MIPILSEKKDKKSGNGVATWCIFFNNVKDLEADTQLSWSEVGSIFGCDAQRADYSYRGAIKRAGVELQKYGRDCILCGGAGVLVK